MCETNELKDLELQLKKVVKNMDDKIETIRLIDPLIADFGLSHNRCDFKKDLGC